MCQGPEAELNVGCSCCSAGKVGWEQTELRQVRPESVQGTYSLERTGTDCKPEKKKMLSVLNWGTRRLVLGR